ncbi:MAG: 6-bladed beta-propeller [Bacteroidales bacterium]|jgi:hypothetical protein
MKPLLTFLTFLTLLTFLNSCQHSDKPVRGLVTLDIIPALSHEKEFRLSDLVDSIEYIKLETRPECLVSNASMVIGKNCILLLNSQPPQVLLFDRNGNFLRPIGKIGKGPGEYIYPNRIDLSPDEQTLIVSDMAQRLFLQYSIDGTFISSHKSDFTSDGPYFIDANHIAFMQTPFDDSIHYPRVVAMNLATGVQKPLYYINYKRNPGPNTGYCFGSDFFRTDEGIIFKDALCDTIYKVSPDLSVTPVYMLKAFSQKAIYYCMSEQEIDAIGSVSPDFVSSQFVFMIGSRPERFHLVYNTSTKEIFRLSKIKDCKYHGNYDYGIINDLDGTDPVWFWGGSYARDNRFTNLLQVFDLKEKIKTGCFTQAELKINRYRDELKKLVATATENDNPIIRIMHLK